MMSLSDSSSAGTPAAPLQAGDDFFIAVERKDIDMLHRLIGARKDVNVVSPTASDYHRTPLHLCVWGNWVEGAKALLDAGADVNALDDLHDSPFLLCGAEGRLEILQHVYQNAEKVKKFGSPGSRRLKTATPDYTVVNRFGGSALIPACERGHAEVARVLLENGVDPNHYNYFHWTGLLEVVELGGDDREHVQIVESLIKAGVDVNQTDAEGQTPLQLARKYGFGRIATLLQAAGGHE